MTTNPTSPSYPEDSARAPAGHTPTPIDFVAEIDRIIDAQKPNTHLWNYCVWNRKALLRSMVQHDMSVRKVLAHHEIMPGRVAANTENLLRDLHALNTYADSQRKIGELREGIKCAVECAPSIFLRDKFAALLKSTE